MKLERSEESIFNTHLLEAKVVACTSGSIWDVGVDLRPNSPTRFQWFGEVLTPENGKSMIVPEGFGHAFITLEPNSTAVYAISAYYAIDYESVFVLMILC